jgi:hypothetical protein
MFEVYRAKSPDEQKFVDKHVTIKHKDRNEVNGKANDDDVFKATNIKTGDRKNTRYGYNVGDDEKVYEENEFFVEEEILDELSDDTLSSYRQKAKPQSFVSGGKDIKKRFNRIDGEVLASSKQSGQAKVNSFTKEDIITRAIEKYMPEVADIKPLTMEQRLAKKLNGLSESHVALLFSLFTNLNEENQMRMIDTCEDRNGINQLIDFALENNRGE